ncbi:unnamed protein product [Choristocarpus tenellus]
MQIPPFNIQSDGQRRLAESEAQQKASERSYERSMAALRDDLHRKLEEEEARRVREVGEARRKSKAVAGALQLLQGELRESEAKGSELEGQVSALSARNRNGSIIRGSGVGVTSGTGGSARRGSVDSARLGEATEAEIATLRRQLQAAMNAKDLAEKVVKEAKSRAEEEGTRRR